MATTIIKRREDRDQDGDDIAWEKCVGVGSKWLLGSLDWLGGERCLFMEARGGN